MIKIGMFSSAVAELPLDQILNRSHPLQRRRRHNLTIEDGLSKAAGHPLLRSSFATSAPEMINALVFLD